MQSIYTRYYGATNTKGARVRAYASGKAGSVTRSYDYEFDADVNHRLAAHALATKMGWAGDWIEGSAPDGRGNVYVHAAGERVFVAPQVRA